MSYAANSRAPQLDPSKVSQEPTGAVTSDSLAADSIKQGGGFAQNDNAVPLSVKGASSTLNTTDTSAASALHPAPSGAAREQQDAMGAGPDERGTTGLKLDALDDPQFSGTHSLQGYSGGPSTKTIGSSASTGPAGASDFGATTTSTSGTPASGTSNITSSSATATSNASAGAGVRPHVPTAPNYTGAVTGDIAPSGTFKPKGSNLDDADLTDSIPKTKTFTGNVGGVNDPGRLAERDFEGVNTEPTQESSQSGTAGGRQRAGELEVGGKFSALESERA
ncbi:hypothetical protein PV10_01579 [Exophiala mesophila]|uniref:Uncharacterized protein n=1 Tax=Exophiala mesophila TaxID=212818 RepID=A0A0D2AG26_EXOME|nr:uncharacterized protein PV10_01579 [Exophiala mesophila]KIV97878.1 hypothetical protein PV10_01579 [Exophiala mesophila]